VFAGGCLGSPGRVEHVKGVNRAVSATPAGGSPIRLEQVSFGRQEVTRGIGQSDFDPAKVQPHGTLMRIFFPWRSTRRRSPDSGTRLGVTQL